MKGMTSLLLMRAGLLQSRISPLSHEGSECSVEMIGEFASGLSNIGGPEPRKQPKDGVVEDSEHLRRMTHAPLCMIFAHRGNTTDNAVRFQWYNHK